MRKIEEKMNQHIRAMLANPVKYEQRTIGGHMVLVYEPDYVGVYLHGNHIASVYPGFRVEPNETTFRHWPTATTRSRLRALGVDAYIKDFTPYINGQPA